MRGIARIGYHAIGVPCRLLWAGGVRAARAAVEAAARLAYRRRELTVVAFLAASLLGGLAVERWNTRAPTTLARLEAEPPRLVAPARASTPRPALDPRPRRPARADRGHTAATSSAPTPVPTPDTPLDLNRATATDLTRLPGIGPRLAARILARREALGGRFDSIDALGSVPGVGQRKAATLAALVTAILPADTDTSAPLEPTEPDGPP